MKILAFSDLHRDAARAEAIVNESRGADVVVGAGDLPPVASAMAIRSMSSAE